MQQRWAATTISNLLNIADADESYPAPSPNQPHEVNTAPRRVWAHKVTEDGPFELISPKELPWYVMYVSNVLIADNTWMMDK